MKVYDAKAIQNLLDMMSEQLKLTETSLMKVENSIIIFADSDFTGKGADAIKNFFKNSHIPLLKYWQTSLVDAQH